MKPANLSEIQEAFSKQAGGFDSGNYYLSKQEYLDYIVEKTAPKKTDNISTMPPQRPPSKSRMVPSCDFKTLIYLMDGQNESSGSV